MEKQTETFETLRMISELLDEHSKSDAREILKMVASRFDLKVESIRSVQIIKTGERKGPRPAQRARWNPEVKAIQQEVKDLNHKIKEESSNYGGKLPENHELLGLRDHAFRRLKDAKGKQSDPQTAEKPKFKRKDEGPSPSSSA
jgi:vacuolar-type H+-ATPase subunit I/STV1